MKKFSKVDLKVCDKVVESDRPKVGRRQSYEDVCVFFHTGRATSFQSGDPGANPCINNTLRHIEMQHPPLPTNLDMPCPATSASLRALINKCLYVRCNQQWPIWSKTKGSMKKSVLAKCFQKIPRTHPWSHFRS